MDAEDALRVGDRDGEGESFDACSLELHDYFWNTTAWDPTLPAAIGCGSGGGAGACGGLAQPAIATSRAIHIASRTATDWDIEAILLGRVRQKGESGGQVRSDASFTSSARGVSTAASGSMIRQ